MIVDGKGVIQKLDTKSVIEFCKQLTVPLVLYGMGENGLFTYQILKNNGITVQAIADGDPKKQNSTIDQLTIINWNKALDLYPNAVVWICIANEKVRNQVINDIHNEGYYPHFLIFNLKYPMDNFYYRDWDQTLPCIIMGKGNALFSAYQVLKKNHCNVSLIVSTDKSEKLKFQEKVKLFSIGMTLPQNANYILCDETKWNEMINALHNQGVCECIYRQVSGGMGIFNPQYYTFTNRIIRNIASSVFLELNGLSQAMVDKNSKQIFKDIICKFIACLKDQKKQVDEKNLLNMLYFLEENKEIKEKYLHKKEFPIPELLEEWNLNQIESNLFEFLNMFKMIYINYLANNAIKYRLIVDENKLNIQIEGR